MYVKSKAEERRERDPSESDGNASGRFAFIIRNERASTIIS
jgi:hypothetical protein